MVGIFQDMEFMEGLCEREYRMQRGAFAGVGANAGGGTRRGPRPGAPAPGDGGGAS